MPEPVSKPTAISRAFALSKVLRWILLAVAAIFFILHFLHLNADFPNNSPWVDWSKYTDEGWYGDAAIRHVLFGHWYWPGDFNPAVALPIWPLLEVIVFRIFGVSAAAGRALTLCVFGVTLLATWLLLERHTRPRSATSSRPLAASLAVLFLCISPFFYVFERMAILEPLLICLTLLALLTASHLHPLSRRSSKKLSSRPKAAHFAAAAERPTVPPAPPQKPTAFQTLHNLSPSIALGLLLPAIVLTKTTGVALFPAIAYMVWARAGYRLRTAIRFAILPAIMTAAIWLSYVFLIVRPHFLADYRYLFSANGYTGIELEPFATVILNTVSDGMWMGHILYPLFFVILAIGLFWRPRLFLNPLGPALLLWTAGYFTFLGYHNNLQPRYYLVVAVPITLLIALGLDTFRDARSLTAKLVAAAAVLAIIIPDAVQTLDFVLHPTYTFRAAAEGIRNIVLADKAHPNLLLSISGSDITLMTGLPSIDDDFGTMELVDRVKAYHPGWYAAWNELDDDKMDALAELYHVERVATFPSMDDPDRNLLILYRLDPADLTPPPTRNKRRTPKPLVTKLGQQPTTQQLQH
jgi:hypothetical protein